MKLIASVIPLWLEETLYIDHIFICFMLLISFFFFLLEEVYHSCKAGRRDKLPFHLSAKLSLSILEGNITGYFSWVVIFFQHYNYSALSLVFLVCCSGVEFVNAKPLATKASDQGTATIALVLFRCTGSSVEILATWFYCCN